ncbi:FMN-binding glutamate synthase family protein, partial [Peribacillus butanolivorans]
MNSIANILIILGCSIIFLIFIVIVLLLIYMIFFDRRQKHHAILRNYPVLGRVRYFLEKIGPE